MILDVVYPLCGMSKGGDDFELRYSLRSLNEQPWVGNLYLIGYSPKWIRHANVIKCREHWPFTFKDKNMIKKMLMACADEKISDPFIANSDDQYWLKSVTPAEMAIPPREYPAQCDLDLAQRPPRVMRSFRSMWVKRQYETVEFLRKQGKSTIRFDGHVPYLIDKQKYVQTMSEIPWEIGNGFLIVVYHGWNWESLGNGFKIEDRDGTLVRIKADLRPEQIEEKTKNALFLNHNNKAFSIGMKEFLKKRFSNPSRWE